MALQAQLIRLQCGQKLTSGTLNKTILFILEPWSFDMEGTIPFITDGKASQVLMSLKVSIFMVLLFIFHKGIIIT